MRTTDTEHSRSFSEIVRMQPDVFNTTKHKVLPLGTYHVSYGTGCMVFRKQ